MIRSKILSNNSPYLPIITVWRCSVVITTFFMVFFFPLISSAEVIEVVIRSLSVMETKPNGTAWDVGFGDMIKPDLKIEIYQNEDLIMASNKFPNTYRLRHTLTSSPFKFMESAALEIKVIDKDLKNDDMIDLFSIVLHHENIQDKKVFVLNGKSTLELMIQVQPSEAALPSTQLEGPPNHLNQKQSVQGLSVKKKD